MKPTGKETISIAIQGGPGAFHEMASRKFFEGNEIEIQPCETFEELFYELSRGSIDFGVVAIENSVAGSILHNYNLLRKSGLQITGEVYLRIVQNLMALPGQRIENLREIHSHPVAIQQCNVYLDNLRRKGVRIVESSDTALSAKWISDNKLAGYGALASRLAAEMYGLEVLEEGVEADKANFTRFLIVASSQRNNSHSGLADSAIDKASVCFSLPHEAGSLSQVLSVLAFYNMNLTKIQSLPIVGKAWEYFFLADLMFTSYQRYRMALDAIRPLTDQFEILGEYMHGGMPAIAFETDTKYVKSIV
ncbi:MAG: prephenate dehydratase [Lentimicrobium sp.]|nr:prephenate dehydratase [Lentimicrobium sp.]